MINNQSRSVLGGIQQCNKLLLFTAESKRTSTDVCDEYTRINSIWYNLWVYKYRTIYWHYVDLLAPNERNDLYESFFFFLYCCYVRKRWAKLQPKRLLSYWMYGAVGGALYLRWSKMHRMCRVIASGRLLLLLLLLLALAFLCWTCHVF